MSFKVGDVCVIVEDLHGNRTGEECVVTSDLAMHFIKDPCGPYCIEAMCYGIRVNGMNHDLYALPCELRLKRPPSDDKQEPRADFTPGEWDLCPWKPTQVKA